MPMLIRKKPNPLRSASSKLIVAIPFVFNPIPPGLKPSLNLID
jgi:hypothetical protein